MDAPNKKNNNRQNNNKMDPKNIQEKTNNSINYRSNTVQDNSVNYRSNTVQDNSVNNRSNPVQNNSVNNRSNPVQEKSNPNPNPNPNPEKMSIQNKLKKQQNEAYERLVQRTLSTMQYGRDKYTKVRETIRNTPIIIKIMNTLVPFFFTYYFTLIQFNLAVSAISALVTFTVIFLLSKVMAIVFIVLYIAVANDKANSFNKYIGNPIIATDILKNKKPYNCLSNYLIVDSGVLPKDLVGGYFSYSFWLYVNGNKNDINKDRNWYSYRYNEWKSIFYRGTEIDKNGNMATLTQYPGFWLTPNLNNMVIVFQNSGYIERIEVTNIPFNKWMNYTVVVEAKSVSIYIDGRFDRAISLYQNVTPMNGSKLYVANDRNISKDKNLYGFAGSIAQLTYYNFALIPQDIFGAYNYYASILQTYQSSIDIEKPYILPKLITNSDFYLEK